jgi:hypothetical protein
LSVTGPLKFSVFSTSTTYEKSFRLSIPRTDLFLLGCNATYAGTKN